MVVTSSSILLFLYLILIITIHFLAIPNLFQKPGSSQKSRTGSENSTNFALNRIWEICRQISHISSPPAKNYLSSPAGYNTTQFQICFGISAAIFFYSSVASASAASASFSFLDLAFALYFTLSMMYVTAFCSAISFLMASFSASPM